MFSADPFTLNGLAAAFALVMLVRNLPKALQRQPVPAVTSLLAAVVLVAAARSMFLGVLALRALH